MIAVEELHLAGNYKRRVTMIWDFVKAPGIVKISPAVMYHREKRLLEFSWLIWSFVILIE